MKIDLQTRYFIAYGLSVLGLIITCLGNGSSQIFKWIGIAMVTVAIILFFTIRCPHCHHGLTGRGIIFLPEICPNCGRKIFESELE